MTLEANWFIAAVIRGFILLNGIFLNVAVFYPVRTVKVTSSLMAANKQIDEMNIFVWFLQEPARKRASVGSCVTEEEEEEAEFDRCITSGGELVLPVARRGGRPLDGL